MSLLKSLLSLAVFLGLSACGGIFQLTEKPSSVSREFEDRPTAKSAFEQAFIQCGEGECPESVVGVFTIQPISSTMGACSGTLIAPDKVLTNEHCLPDDLSEVGISCTGRIRFAFAATGAQPQESMDCESVEQVSEVRNKKDSLRPDWAILKLKRAVQRPFRSMNRESGLVPSQPVTLYKINFDLHRPVPMGSTQETSCLANTPHFLSRENIGPLSAIFNISDCKHKLIKGNSGSGVVNKQGELVGLFSYLNPIEDASESSMDKLRSRFPDMKQDTGGGTQVACIPFDNQDVSPLCQFDRTYWLRAFYYQDLVSQRIHPDFKKAEVEIEQGLIQQDPLHIQWGAWQENPSKQLVFDESMGAQHRFLARLELSNKYPWIPHCVEITAPDRFSVSWYTRNNFDLEVINIEQGYRRTLPSQAQITSLSVIKSEENLYQVKLELDFYDVQLRLPICD